jgi:hypothetical protein
VPRDKPEGKPTALTMSCSQEIVIIEGIVVCVTLPWGCG